MSSSIRGGERLEFQLCRHLDRRPQRPVQRAAVGEHAVHPFGGLFLIRQRLQMESDVNPPDHQDAFFQFHFAGRIRHQAIARGTDFARLQRAPEGTRQSTGRTGDDVVDRGRVWFEQVWRNFIVSGNGAMNSKNHRVWFGGKIGAPDWTFHPLDPDLRTVCDVRHESIIGVQK